MCARICLVKIFLAVIGESHEMIPVFLFHFFRMCMKQFQCPRLDAGEYTLIRIRKLAFEPRGSQRMTVILSAFIRFG